MTRISTRPLIEGVARYYGVTFGEIMARDTKRRFVIARRGAICAVVNARHDMSYPRVARIFGLDHTTLYHHLHAAGAFQPRRGPPLSVADLAEAREMKRRGVIVRHIAERFDVSISKLYRILRDHPTPGAPAPVA